MTTASAESRREQPDKGVLLESVTPPQHQEPPGLESELEPRPRYEAARYKAAGKLEKKWR